MEERKRRFTMNTYPPPRINSALIVITLWQNNLAHDDLGTFQQETRQALANVRGISFTARDNGNLPQLVIENQANDKRLASYVVIKTAATNANAVASEVQRNWIGANQPGISRGFDLGNGYKARGNCRDVTDPGAQAEYADAFRVLKGERLAREPSRKVKSIVAYLEKKLNPRWVAPPSPLTPPRRSSGRPQGRGGSASRGRRSRARA